MSSSAAHHLLLSLLLLCLGLSNATTTTLVQVITTVPQSINLTSHRPYDWYEVPYVWYDATAPRMVGQVFWGPITGEAWSVAALQANLICTRGCAASPAGNYITVGLVIYQTASSAPPYNCGGPVAGCALNQTLLMSGGTPIAAVFTFPPTGACMLNVNDVLYYAGFTAFAPTNNAVGLIVQQNTNGRAYAGYANTTYVPGGTCSGGNGVGPGTNQMNVQSFYLTGTASTLGPATPLTASAAPTPAPTTSPTTPEPTMMNPSPAPSGATPRLQSGLALILVGFYLILV